MTVKKGDKIRIIIDTPAGQPINGVVTVVQDVPGKTIGVELDQTTAYAHSLDGALKGVEKIDPTNGIRYGKGWWTLEENIEKQ